MVTSFKYLNDVTDQRAASMWTTCGCLFLIFPIVPVQICEIELSHMGKNNRHPNLECEKMLSNPVGKVG